MSIFHFIPFFYFLNVKIFVFFMSMPPIYYYPFSLKFTFEL
jgi:hypothetical protein